MTKTEQQAEALHRARNGESLVNYPTILQGFADKGIYDAKPRVNVFTYAAWQKLGRQVQKGQHGVKIVTYIECKTKADEEGKRESYRRPRNVTVFHKSQTEAI